MERENMFRYRYGLYSYLSLFSHQHKLESTNNGINEMEESFKRLSRVEIRL